MALAIVATTPQQSYAAVGHTSSVTESVANATGTAGSPGEQFGAPNITVTGGTFTGGTGVASGTAGGNGGNAGAGIIETMSEALDDIKKRYGFTQIELVGYSGGGAVALLVAAQRNDILNIRTVAGNPDTDAFTKLHHVSGLKQSLNPADVASALAKIPQMHFIGRDDDVVPSLIYQSYVNHIFDKRCVHSQVIEDATHQEGWIDSWPAILKEEPFCLNKT